MYKTAWIDRIFPPIADNGLLPSLLERLEGSPVRIESLLHLVNPPLLILSPKGKWTVQEEIGHLIDLEPLWLQRVHEIINDFEMLTAADMSNRKTYEANHNLSNLNTLLASFREHRSELIILLRSLHKDQFEKSSMHPRLKTPMRIVDLVNFIAEHDDHHISSIRQKLIESIG